MASYDDTKRSYMDRAEARVLANRGSGLVSGLRKRTDGDLPDLSMDVETSDGGPSVDVDSLTSTASPRAGAGLDVSPFSSPPESYDSYVADKKSTPTTSADKKLGKGVYNNPRVRSLQQSLKDVADFTKEPKFDPKGIDGDFGGNTEAALKAFQKTYGLPVTGVADTATLSKLQQEQERVTAGKPSLREGESDFDQSPDGPDALSDRTRYSGVRPDEQGDIPHTVGPITKVEDLEGEDPIVKFANMNDLQLDALALARVLSREQVEEIKQRRDATASTGPLSARPEA